MTRRLKSLQKKIMENVEWKLLPKAVSLFCEDRIRIKDGKGLTLTLKTEKNYGGQV